MRKISMLQTEQDKTIAEGFKKFIKFCKVKNLSEETIVYYRAYTEQFTHYLNSQGIYLIRQLNHVVICDYTLYLKDKGIYSPVTINTNLRGITSLGTKPNLTTPDEVVDM